MLSRPGSKRVLHVIRRLDVRRGAERMVAEFVRTLPNHDVLVFDGGPSAYPLGSDKLRRARNFVDAIWQCFRLRKQYDILHLHLAPSKYLAILFGKRAIIHEHSTFRLRQGKSLPRLLSRIAARRAKVIIAVSEAARENVLSRLDEQSNVVALPNFVAQLPAPAPVPDMSDDLLMVAAFESGKRQDLVIQALPHLPQDFSITFAGEGPTLADCHKLAEDLGVAGRAKFLGSVQNISDYYASARLCVLISEWEGFGLVVLEAAQFGKATVVSDIDGLRQACPDPRLLFHGATPKELADKLVKVLDFCERSDFRDRLIQHADRHGLETYVSKLDEIYALACAGN